jgi:hypothetical protein
MVIKVPLSIDLSAGKRHAGAYIVPKLRSTATHVEQTQCRILFNALFLQPIIFIHKRDRSTRDFNDERVCIYSYLNVIFNGLDECVV